MEFLGILPQLPIKEWISQYGYWAVFAVVGLESAGAPLPGEITLVTAAIVAAATHNLDIWYVILAAIGGAVLGDNIGYWIGREFGFPLLLRYGPRVGIKERELKLGQYLFLRHGGKVVFFGRMVAVLRVLAALLAGVNRMNWPHFLICNVGGAVLWACLYGGGAYFLGHQIKHITGPLGISFLAIGVIVTVLGLRYIARHQRRLQECAEEAFPGPIDPQAHRRPPNP